jgi:glycosyltransferase involved in cell wall biosynthesis
VTLLVSVIIPCRNGEAWLAEAVESCLTQTWPDVEIIVVDNGSTDGSLGVARSYAARGVAVLECAKGGASAARNAGLAQARGDFIQFLDADDALDGEKIRRQVERLASAPAGSLASGAWARFRRFTGEESFAPEPVWADLAADEFLIRSWLGGGMMPNFAWLTPRALIGRAGLWNESLNLDDDGEFFSRVVLASSGIVFCGDARGFYRSGNHASLSRRYDAVALASAFSATELACGHLLSRCASDVARRACATHYQRFVYAAYPHAAELVARAEKRIRELGGSDLLPGGGRTFRLLSRGLGWKFAKRCQLAWHSLRQAQAAVQ